MIDPKIIYEELLGVGGGEAPRSDQNSEAAAVAKHWSGPQRPEPEAPREQPRSNLRRALPMIFFGVLGLIAALAMVCVLFRTTNPN